MSFNVQHSYYWRRGGNLKSTKTEASAKLPPMHPSLKHSLQEWRSQPLQQAGRFRFSFRKTARQQAVGSSFSVKEEDSACIQKNRNHGCGLAHFSALGWNHAGGNGRISAHDPRLFAAQQPPCHEQISAGDVEDQTLGTGQTGRRYFADGYFAEDKADPMNAVCERFRMGTFSSGAYRPLTSPDLLDVRVASA
jgi:hypothetical protein